MKKVSKCSLVFLFFFLLCSALLTEQVNARGEQISYPMAGGCGTWQDETYHKPYCSSDKCGILGNKETSYQTVIIKRKCVDSSGNYRTERLRIKRKLGCC